MTCKDCIHSGLCYKENDYENFPDRCGDFIPETPQGDLISREALRKDFEERNKACDKWIAKAKDEETKIRAEATKHFICEDKACKYRANERSQGELAEKLNERIEESVCKYCYMNKHCELCEISRVFQIIDSTLADEVKSTKDLINNIAGFDVSGIKPLPEYNDGITDAEQKGGAE